MVETENKNKLFIQSRLSRRNGLIWGALALLLVASLVSFLVFKKHLVHSFLAIQLFGQETPIKLERTDIDTNIHLNSSGRAVIVSAGVITSHGAKYTFDKPSVINLLPCPRISVRLPLLDGKHLPIYSSIEDRWQSAIRRATIKCNPLYFQKEVLLPGSFRLESSGNNASTASKSQTKPITNILWSKSNEYFYGADNMVLINRSDRDFTLFSVFEITRDLCRLKSASSALYEAKTRRIDTLCLGEQGKLQLIPGIPSEFAPLPPILSSGLIPLANILAPSDKDNLVNTDICSIQSEKPVGMDEAITRQNRSALRNVRKKLESGLPVKVLFYGDSITCGGSVMDARKSFPQVFIKQLSEKYVKAQITSINKGLGETSASTRYRRFQSEVLSLQPDLIVIEFVNDYKLSEGKIERAYGSILSAAKSAGVEVIICTPHLLKPQILGYSSWEQIANSPYITKVRALAKKYNIALCDVASRWQHIEAEGTKPYWLLTDKMIHINETGHKIYAEELLKCFS